MNSFTHWVFYTIVGSCLSLKYYTSNCDKCSSLFCAPPAMFVERYVSFSTLWVWVVPVAASLPARDVIFAQLEEDYFCLFALGAANQPIYKHNTSDAGKKFSNVVTRWPRNRERRGVGNVGSGSFCFSRWTNFGRIWRKNSENESTSSVECRLDDT